MRYSRRTFTIATAAAALAPVPPALAAESKPPMIIDTHQHLWDLAKFKLPWLENATGVLARSYVMKDYFEATKGLDVQAIYMEVDVDPAQHLAEAEHVVGLMKDKANSTVAATVGGRPASDQFAAYVAKLKKMPQIKGVRQVLHGDAPRGFCLGEAFVRGVKLLGDNGLHFDLCLRPGELNDGLKLAKLCPETRFVVDHCGNADPKAFVKNDGHTKLEHDPNAWRRSIDELAKQENVICKISGIIARVPKEWSSDMLAPIVNHCLDAFGPDRVVFGSDWPVCLLGAPLRAWVDALAEIIAERPADARDKLWHANAQKFYSL